MLPMAVACGSVLSCRYLATSRTSGFAHGVILANNSQTMQISHVLYATKCLNKNITIGASEVTTLWRYTNLFINIIIIIK